MGGQTSSKSSIITQVSNISLTQVRERHIEQARWAQITKVGARNIEGTMMGQCNAVDGANLDMRTARPKHHLPGRAAWHLESECATALVMAQLPLLLTEASGALSLEGDCCR